MDLPSGGEQCFFRPVFSMPLIVAWNVQVRETAIEGSEAQRKIIQAG
jgi:hypothetical protein